MARHIRTVIRRRYLGAGVYAAFDDFGGVWLTAEDSISTTDVIYLEPGVYEALRRFVHEAKAIGSE